MTIGTTLARPQSLTSIARESIRNAITGGELAFGAQLSESVLALRFGISKTPVREALLQLRLEGLVDIIPQKGTFVFEPDEDQVREICRFREIVETAALAEAIRADAPGLARRLRNALAEGAAAGGRHAEDALFHGAIIAGSGNAYLAASYQLVADKIQALRARLPRDNGVDACHDTHTRVATLAAAADAEGACDALREHIRSTEQSYVGAIHAKPASA
jgi:DNA-binding GntR family transcriptional regulator